MAKTLIIAPNWVGDMVMSQCLYRLLKKDDANHEIHVLAPPWCLDVALRMPEVSKCIAFPGIHGKLDLLKRYRFSQQLKKENYQNAIILPNSLKSALIPWLAKIPTRIGYKGEMRYGLINDIRYLDKKKQPLMVERFASLNPKSKKIININEILIPKLAADATKISTTLKTYHLNQDKPILALAPSAAFGNSKCWPKANFSALANQFLEKGFHVWLMGAPSDEKRLQTINDACQQKCQMVTKPSLQEKIDLLSISDCLVSNDSGLMHIGAALNIPVIGIYGSTTPSFTPPLGDKTKVIENNDLICRPCFKRDCPKQEKDHLKCLWDITPKKVEQEILTLLKAHAKMPEKSALIDE